MSNTIIEPPEVYKILNNLNMNKATRPDGLSNNILKKATPALAQPLCKLLKIDRYLLTTVSLCRLMRH